MNRKPGEAETKQDRKQDNLIRLTRSDLRRGILQQEILGSPRALKPFPWTLFRRR